MTFSLEIETLTVYMAGEMCSGITNGLQPSAKAPPNSSQPCPVN